MKCYDCFYYTYSRLDEYHGQIGKCRYNPPVYNEKRESAFPTVIAKYDWCGKFKESE